MKDGIFYFNKRGPADLRRHYSSDKIAYSLRTRSRTVAIAWMNAAAVKLDEYWFHLRSHDAELPGPHLLRHGLSGCRSGTSSGAVTTDALTLTEAVVTYNRLKGVGRPKSFERAEQRSCGCVIDVRGDTVRGAQFRSHRGR
ncbi:DUF6538 domain-containing protein [Arenibacterium sp. LLYu02]|uniref:DUF6538 domain-containing protein n=1 Tax=Arenibacterium sp. LLYu02 TaxID=3404132 RepID=UPI003B218451